MRTINSKHEIRNSKQINESTKSEARSSKQIQHMTIQTNYNVPNGMERIRSFGFSRFEIYLT